MWKTVLFDLDGTLTDSAPGITRSVAHALEHFGIHEEPEKLLKFIGPPLNESLPEFYGFTPEQTAEAVKVFREYFVEKGWCENAPYPGIGKLLQDLRRAGLRLMVATSKPEVQAVRILNHFGLAEYFERICGAPEGNEDGARKASVIRRALSYVSNDTSSVVMVGDRWHDVVGAHEAGIPCIGVLYGYGGRKEFEDASAEFVAEDMAALRHLLLFDVKLGERWLKAFGAGLDPERVRDACYRGCLWPPRPRNGAPVLEGEEARRAFDALEYDTAYIFREGVTQAGVTAKVTAAELAQMQGIGAYDVYVVDKDFRWTYVHTHEDGWMGPYFCALD